tara:strand:+ start:11595 stop:12554 length:960 start_codon:yes stop_codon:yes gene_type:complete
MELVKRYIAAVQRELPEPKRQEIGRELQANIMDQLDALAEQQGGELAEQQLADVLKAMGHPTQVARQFCPIEPLIPAHLMPLYKHTLFMVLGVFLVLQVVFMTKAWLMGADFGLFRFVMGLASGFIEDAVFGFTAITVGFAVAFKGKQARVCSTDKQWQPQDLPPVAAGWQHISLSDIFTDLASYVFLLLVIWFPLWQQHFAEASADSSVFSSHSLQLLMWFSPVIVLGVLSSLWQLQRRIWNRQLLTLNVLVNLAFTLMFITLAFNEPLLQLDLDTWSRHFDPSSLQLSVKIFLLAMALIPGYEVVRDVLRLQRFRKS